MKHRLLTACIIIAIAAALLCACGTQKPVDAQATGQPAGATAGPTQSGGDAEPTGEPATELDDEQIWADFISRKGWLDFPEFFAENPYDLDGTDTRLMYKTVDLYGDENDELLIIVTPAANERIYSLGVFELNDGAPDIALELITQYGFLYFSNKYNAFVTYEYQMAASCYSFYVISDDDLDYEFSIYDQSGQYDLGLSTEEPALIISYNTEDNSVEALTEEAFEAYLDDIHDFTTEGFTLIEG